MPETTARLHHVDEGPRDATPVLLGASLGTTHRLWDDLAADLATDHRVVRFDTRGHGGSPVPEGPWTVSDLAADVVALADELGLDRFGYLGISLGGAVGQLLALDQADRLSSLTLACTAARFGDPATWADRARSVRAEGTGALVEPTRARWFTAETQQERPDEVDRVMAMLTATPAEGYARCCEALAAYDARDRLSAIGVPTLVIAGSEDPTAGPDSARELAGSIPEAELVVLEGAAHLAHLARPDAFTAAVRRHLSRHGQHAD